MRPWHGPPEAGAELFVPARSEPLVRLAAEDWSRLDAAEVTADLRVGGRRLQRVDSEVLAPHLEEAACRPSRQLVEPRELTEQCDERLSPRASLGVEAGASRARLSTVDPQLRSPHMDEEHAGPGRTTTPPGTPDFSLTADELRAVTSFAAAAAAPVLPIFESLVPDDPRPRQALQAALAFAGGAPRSKLQRTAAPASHRAARIAPTPAGFHAAMAAGDAAASAYLHPLADAAQVGHILRAAAHAARACELHRPAEPNAAQRAIEQAAARATPTLVSVLSRYPVTSPGSARVAELMHHLDTLLRARSHPGGDRG